MNWNLRTVGLVAGGTFFVLLVIAYSVQRAINEGWL